MLKYMAMSQCITISKYATSLTLADFLFLADYLSTKLINEAFFNLSYIAKTIKFLLNNIIVV